MARKKPTSAAATAAGTNVDKAAPAAAPATVVQPASAATGLETGNKGPDAPPIIVMAHPEIAAYLEQLKAAGEVGLGDLIPLKDLSEPLLRQVGQFVEIEGHDVLPSEQLVSMIEAKVGLAPSVAAAPGAAVSDPPALDADAAAAALAAAADNAMDDDGDVEGLWVTAVPEQGFRRCGFRFTREGVGIALSALTEAQIEQLENEPNLKVERGIFGGRVGVQ